MQSCDEASCEVCSGHKSACAKEILNTLENSLVSWIRTLTRRINKELLTETGQSKNTIKKKKRVKFQFHGVGSREGREWG